MTPLLFGLAGLSADLVSTLIGLRMGGREMNPAAKGWKGLTVNAVLLALMFWQFNTPEGWYAFGGVHFAAALWNTYQIVKAR